MSALRRVMGGDKEGSRGRKEKKNWPDLHSVWELEGDRGDDDFGR